MGKGVLRVDDGAVEGEALTLVNRHRPSQSQGVLSKNAFHFFANLLRFFVEHVSGVGPLLPVEFNLFSIGILHGDATRR